LQDYPVTTLATLISTEIEIELIATDYVSSAPSIELSRHRSATQALFMRARAGRSSDWHASSARVLFFVLSGEWEVTASDAESRQFGVGSALLVEDTKGKGHSSRVIGEDESLAAMIELDYFGVLILFHPPAHAG
jgi:hypothetical protein